MKKKYYKWDLSRFYSSENDPKIEMDIQKLESTFEAFSTAYNTKEKLYLKDENVLYEALSAFEKCKSLGDKPYIYFVSRRDTNGKDMVATSRISLLDERITRAENKVIFFELSLGTITPGLQKKFLASEKLAPFRVYLQRRFDDAKYNLSEKEEHILKLKTQPSHDMWVSGNERLLSSQSISWKGKKISIPEASKMGTNAKTFAERYKIHALIGEAYKKVAPFSEAEVNAIVFNKRIEDELRGFKKPYEETVYTYRNDIKVVETLVQVVTESFPLSQRYYELKKKLLKQKILRYPDRMVKSASVKQKFDFDFTISKLGDIFGAIDPKYMHILNAYLENGQFDVYPKIGKRGGAYCRSSKPEQVMVFLNHTDDFYSFTTVAHEMGHAFHAELSRVQNAFYYDCSYALAETASTLFESIAFSEALKELPPSQKIAALETKLDNEMATIFRQIACFNFENEIHETVKKKGFATKEELAQLHNKHMSQYLGKAFSLTEDDGYFFVGWSHIRRFFYVYSYAYGLLVSKALLRRYKADPTFWKKIEQFLSSGGNGSPEEILAKIGIDIKDPAFFKEGIEEIESDINVLEKLVKERKK